MERVIRVGVFDDLNKAEHAIGDAVAAGVHQEDITVVVSSEKDLAREAELKVNLVVHPVSDTERGHFGGAIGGAIGGLIGSIMMFVLQSSEIPALWVSIPVGIAAGFVAGGLVARWLPRIISRFLGRPPAQYLGAVGHGFDTWRSMLGGAIGGAFGAIGGTMGSYFLGIPNWWFFITTGLYAAALSLIFGALVGAMTGRGLAPRTLGMLEDLADSDNTVLVSIDCTDQRETVSQIEQLLHRDGALMVRPA